MKEERFNKIFSTCIMVGMLVAVGITTAIKAQDPSTRMLMLAVASLGSVMGVASTVLSANGLIWTFLFGIADVVLDSIVAFDAGAMGNFALHAFYFLPMQFVGIAQWRKRGATKEEKVKARRLDSRGWIMLVAGIAVSLATAWYILLRIDESRFDAGAIESVDRWKVFFDAAVLVLNIAGQILMSLAFFEQWIVWNFVNVFSILLWGSIMLSSEASSYTVVMFVKYCFYLLNSLNGLRIWQKLSR
ncbi:MAG: nicotinamide mononucleotide transporter [Bacteroidales bacterium]|nr:nicotinamide mononucleotide transporter [Bacteroidales bacterium]